MNLSELDFDAIVSELLASASCEHCASPSHCSCHNLQDINAGGPGSGCNPEVGKCGRPAGAGSSKPDEVYMGTPAVHFISKWQKNHKGIRSAASKLITGSPLWGNHDNRDLYAAQTLLNELRTRAEHFDTPLYRGMAITDPKSPVLGLKLGDEYQMPELDSFSKDPRMAHNFSDAKEIENETHVVLELEGADGIDVAKYSRDRRESEVITNGRFKVVSVSDESYESQHYHKVKVQQMGLL